MTSSANDQQRTIVRSQLSDPHNFSLFGSTSMQSVSAPEFPACDSAQQQHFHSRVKQHTFTSAPPPDGPVPRYSSHSVESRREGTQDSAEPCGSYASEALSTDETPAGCGCPSPSDTADGYRSSSRASSPPPGGTSMRISSLDSSKTFSHLVEDRSCSPARTGNKSDATSHEPTSSAPQRKRRGKKSAAALEAERREKKNNRERQRRQEVNDAFDELTRLLQVKRAHKSDKVTVLQAAVQALQAAEASLGPQLFDQIRRGKTPAVMQAPHPSLRQMSDPLPAGRAASLGGRLGKPLDHTREPQQRGTKRVREGYGHTSPSSPPSRPVAAHTAGVAGPVHAHSKTNPDPPTCSTLNSKSIVGVLPDVMGFRPLPGQESAHGTGMPVLGHSSPKDPGPSPQRQAPTAGQHTAVYPTTDFMAGQLSMEDDLDDDDGIPWDFESLGLGPPPGDGFSHLFVSPHLINATDQSQCPPGH